MTSERRLLRYLKPYRLRIVWAVLSMCGVAAFNGAAVLILKPIVDDVLIARDFRMLWLAVVCVPLVIALKTVLSYAQNYLMRWLGQRVTQELRADLFRRLHALPLDYFASHKSGEILSSVTGDLIVVQTALNSLPLYIIRDSMTVLVLLGSLFWLDRRFALLSLAGVPLIGVVLFILSRKMRATSQRAQAMLAQISHRFQEAVQGMAVIRAFNYEEGMLAKFDDENESFFAPMMSYLRATALSGPLTEVAGAFVAAAILYFGGREVIDGRMTPGAFFAFLGAFFAAYAPVKNVARSNSELQRALASAERLFEILDEHPSSRRTAPPQPFAGLTDGIVFEDVCFRYPGQQEWALENVSFSIRKGERVAIAGPSGSGKTTIGQLLLRLHEPASGRVLVDGVDIRDLDARDLRAQIGLVSQQTVLFNDTVFANVALGRPVVTMSEVERACMAAGAAPFVLRLPGGYGAKLGEFGQSLSTGQRQKLAIARVLLKDPSVVVLDEATANLDGPSEADVLAAVERLFPGRTVISIAHKLTSMPRVDRILVLNAGRLAESGSHAELWAKKGLYRRLYELQDAIPA